MLNKEILLNNLGNVGLSQKDSVLMLLAFDVDTPKSISQIRLIASDHGLREAMKWNIGRALSSCKGLAVKLSEGWILTNNGKEYVSNIIGLKDKRSAIKTIAVDLHKLVDGMKDSDTRAFINEAISCFELGNYRASVVLSWVGAVSLLYKHVINNVLPAFNSEATRRDAKWKTASTIDDLGRMKEKEFLEILVAISIIGKNLKQELENCLILRNSCGHPNSFVIGENRVAAHLESLILNVYSKF